MFVKLKVSAPL